MGRTKKLMTTAFICSAGLVLSGCVTSPMDLVPQSARFLIEADMRKNAATAKPAGPISVAQLIAQARNANSEEADGKDEIVDLGAAGVGLTDEDGAAFGEALKAHSQATHGKIEINIGSAGGRTTQGLVFKTFGAVADLQRLGKADGRDVDIIVKPDIEAGRIQVRFIFTDARHDT